MSWRSAPDPVKPRQWPSAQRRRARAIQESRGQDLGGARSSRSRVNEDETLQGHRYLGIREIRAQGEAIVFHRREQVREPPEVLGLMHGLGVLDGTIKDAASGMAVRAEADREFGYARTALPARWRKPRTRDR